MLPWEEVVRLFPMETDRFHFVFGLGLGHFVKGLDLNLGILGAVFEEKDTPSGAEGFHKGSHHFTRVGELMVGIDEKGGIDGIRRKLDVFDGS